MNLLFPLVALALCGLYLVAFAAAGRTWFPDGTPAPGDDGE